MTAGPLVRTYPRAAAAVGPLLFLAGARGVALGEWVEIRQPGEPPRRGQVIDAGEALTAVEVLEDPAGLAPGRAAVTLTGEVAATPVGEELLGRAFDGLGRPRDGLPPPIGEALLPVMGAPLNPARRLRPADFIETGVSAIDGLNTLVRGQKLPIFSAPGLPALELAAAVVENARAPRGEPFAVVFVGVGITAREEIPGRRGYPGYMYTDLASIFERAGLVAGRSGSLTQVPVLTMPDDDITHPIPDLAGYITEGQVVLSRDLHRRGVFPPVDVLPSLSRLMNAGIGPGRTVPEHRRWADQLYAVYAQGREARLMAAIVGEAGLGAADRRALEFAERFERELIGQGEARRTIGETVALGWRLLDTLPRAELRRLDAAAWSARRAREEGGA
jgi:vacuolar-type H+-ATPase subunit B/Vma2